MENVNELIEHNVVVDKYIDVKIKIPKKLDALELKALMTKAQRLLSLSEISVIPKQAAIGNSKIINNKTNYNFINWTDKMDSKIKEIVKEKGGTTGKAGRVLSEMTGKTIKAHNILSRITSLKRQGVW